MEKQKKDNKKKNKRNDERQKAIEKAQKELEDLITNMNNLMGDEENPIKMLEIRIPTRKEKILGFIINVVLSIIVLLSLTGFIDWLYYDNILFLFAFIIIVIASECFLNWVIMYFFGKYILYSFGTIKILAPIIGFLVGIFVFPLVEIKNIALTIFVFILYNVLKKVMSNTIQKLFISKMFKKR